MTIQILTDFFMWCTLINFGLLMLSALIIITARDWAYKMHGRWFDISRSTFDLVLYCFIGAYKTLFLIFCFVPWIALRLIS